MARKSYYLRFCGRPLCDWMGCEAGRLMCEEADVAQCGYTTVTDARRARRRIERLPGKAGSVSIHEGECPSAIEAALFG